MNLSRTLRRCLSVTVAMTALLFSIIACGEEPEPAALPEVDLDDLITGAAEAMAAMSTVKFEMVDEQETGAKFFGTTFKSLEAEVEAPDSFSMVVDVEAPGFGFVEISMLAVGDQAFMKLSADAPWNPLPLDQVPFNFAGLGMTLRDLLLSIKDGAVLAGSQSLDGREAIRIEASIASEGLLSLISGADPGHEVALSLWIDEAEHGLRQMRITGRIYDDDGPETVRLLTIVGIDVPVQIRIPDIASGS